MVHTVGMHVREFRLGVETRSCRIEKQQVVMMARRQWVHSPKPMLGSQNCSVTFCALLTSFCCLEMVCLSLWWRILLHVTYGGTWH
jgi:hypothetical protein